MLGCFKEINEKHGVSTNLLLHKVSQKRLQAVNCELFGERRKKSLLRRLQAQTLPNEAPPVGKIYLISKIAVTFEPIQRS